MTVVFIDTVHEVLWQDLEKAGVECVDATSQTINELSETLKIAEGIVIRSRFRMDESLLKFAPNLKFIARSGAGMENIDQTYCEGRGIKLFNAPEGNKNAVAEHALGMLMMLFNRLHLADLEVREGIWDREGNRGHEIEGKTIGIIGFGNNGSQFAKVLQGFDCRVLAYDKYLTSYEKYGVEAVSLEELQAQADIISLHIPQTEETLGMIDEAFISSVSNPFYLINLSRGKIVRSRDLLNGIDRGKVLGACLDVLEFESSSFESALHDKNQDLEALLNSNKVVFSPHVGGWTHESYYKLSKVLSDKILGTFR